MNEVAKEINQKPVVVDAEGKEYSLHSETSLAQCEFLQSLIAEVDACVCLEIGFAYGISSLYIAEAIANKNAPRFISVDPFQSEWHEIGLLNLERAGYSPFVEFHRDISHNVLPSLLAAGERIDFAYVDTSKIFDVVLVDAYYLSRLLRVGGMLVFDDCTFPGLRKMARYISKWPHFEVAYKHNAYEISPKRRALSRPVKMLPGRAALFTDALLEPEEELGINAQCIAFRKIGEDDRNWDWSCNF
jgi:predicted O-methyltransferase YrrM